MPGDIVSVKLSKDVRFVLFLQRGESWIDIFSRTETLDTGCLADDGAFPLYFFAFHPTIVAGGRNCSDDNRKEVGNNRDNGNNKHNGNEKRGPHTIIVENKTKEARKPEAWEGSEFPALEGGEGGLSWKLVTEGS